MSAEALPSFWQRLGDARVRDLVKFSLSPRLNWKQSITSAELPANCRGLIEHVVRRTRLWKREKADVARELIAHFQDGIAAGVSADELVAEFGDVAQAAKLIRRAKRRGRPLVWHAWHWTYIAVVSVIALYVLMTLYQWTGRPKITVNYLAQINARALSAAADDRSWPLYRQALKQVLVDHQFYPDWLWDCAWNTNLPPNDLKWKEAKKWLVKHDLALSLIRQATKRPAFGLAISLSPAAFAAEDREVLFKPGATDHDPNTGSGLADESLLEDFLTADLPHREKLLRLSDLLVVDARCAAREGNGDRALADVEGVLGISKHIEQIPLLGQAFTADAVQADVCGAIRDMLNERPDLWSNEQIRNLAHTISAAGVEWSRVLEGDRLRVLDKLQRLYTDNGHGNGRLAFRGPSGLNHLQRIGFVNMDPTREETVPHDTVSAAVLPAVNAILPSRKEALALYDHYAAGLMEQIADPVWHRESPLDKEREELYAGIGGSLRYHFVANLLPYHPRLRADVALMRGTRDGVLVGLALELYHREHKAWPKSLNELSPRWLPAVPIDRITGGPLKYKVVDDRPLVYSVGVDGDDDDGGRRSATPLNPYPDQNSPNLGSPDPQDPTYDGDWVLWGPRIKPAADDAAKDGPEPGTAGNPFG